MVRGLIKALLDGSSSCLIKVILFRCSNEISAGKVTKMQRLLSIERIRTDSTGSRDSMGSKSVQWVRRVFNWIKRISTVSNWFERIRIFCNSATSLLFTEKFCICSVRMFYNVADFTRPIRLWLTARTLLLSRIQFESFKNWNRHSTRMERNIRSIVWNVVWSRTIQLPKLDQIAKRFS